MKTRVFSNSRIISVSGTLSNSVGNHQSTWQKREGLLLILQSHNDFGVGEASPLPGYSPDTLEDCQKVLTDIHKKLSPFSENETCLQILEQVLSPLESLFANKPAARFALETAILDLISRYRGHPISGFVKKHQRISQSILLSGGMHGEYLEEARTLFERGIRNFKIKIGHKGVPFETECQDLYNLKKNLPSTVVLRLDANGAWTVNEAKRNLDVLSEIAPEFVEEPVSGKDLASLGVCSVPWASDESLSLQKLRRNLLDAPGCSTLVLKPALIGGFLPVLSLAKKAKERSLSTVVSHLFGGPIALAASCELAFMLPSRVEACGLSLHQGLSSWPSVPILQCHVPSYIVPSEQPGLGIDINLLWKQ